MRGSVRFALLGLAVLAATWATVLTSVGGPAGLPRHLVLFVLAGVVWVGAVIVAPRLRAGTRDRAVIVGIAVLLRVPAWLAPPVHSDDVFRYVWDGRVSRAGINPYRYAPDDPALAHLRDGEAAPVATGVERGAARPTSGAGVYPRINNRDLPTIYPPAAQLLFLVAALVPGPPLLGIKLALAACDLGVLALLLLLAGRLGRDSRGAIAWAWSPLVVVEIAQNAHLEPLPLLGIVGALYARAFGHAGRAGALLGLAAAAKLVGAPLLVALRSPRAWVAAGLACVVLALPFASAGRAMAGSTGEFARRWRSNEGAYALVQAVADRLVCRALGAPHVPRAEGPACDAPLDLWPHVGLAALISGRPARAAVYPDELAAFAARAIVGAALACVVLGVLIRTWRRPDDVVVTLSGMEWILGALLLLTPALKPWYATWLLPFAALGGRPAWLALAALVPLGYVPMAAWLDGAPWRDPIWTRLVLHGVVWALLLLGVRGFPPTGNRAPRNWTRPRS